MSLASGGVAPCLTTDWVSPLVNPLNVVGKGLVDRPSRRVKILGTGTLGKALTVRAHRSASRRRTRLRRRRKAEVIK